MKKLPTKKIARILGRPLVSITAVAAQIDLPIE
ncbi:hypothetical protein SAMN05444158_2265 [Bradyrhizobium canariense]|uniref:Uncharacterized protein n=1 Tax=Bradyrhizobium canariense TaxID=255045 RepID=A0A1H1SRZ6_9BRAD|nr:hypothetical protein SAMN05444158_2265 [Bradyrhizobium canariense]